MYRWRDVFTGAYVFRVAYRHVFFLSDSLATDIPPQACACVHSVFICHDSLIEWGGVPKLCPGHTATL